MLRCGLMPLGELIRYDYTRNRKKRWSSSYWSCATYQTRNPGLLNVSLQVTTGGHLLIKLKLMNVHRCNAKLFNNLVLQICDNLGRHCTGFRNWCCCDHFKLNPWLCICFVMASLHKRVIYMVIIRDTCSVCTHILSRVLHVFTTLGKSRLWHCGEQ